MAFFSLSSKAYIYNGAYLEDEVKYPWIIQFRTGQAHGCMGSIIKKQYEDQIYTVTILTAAHCLKSDLYFGPLNNLSVYSVGKKQEYLGEVKSIFKSPFYSKQTIEGKFLHRHDIAFARLEVSKSLFEHLEELKLDFKNRDQEQGQVVSIKHLNIQLDGNEVTALENSFVRGIFSFESKNGDYFNSSTSGIFDPEGQYFQAKYSNQTDSKICKGDSGSTLFVEEQGSFLGIGIASFKDKTELCSMSNYSSFLSLQGYEKFIKFAIDQKIQEGNVELSLDSHGKIMVDSFENTKSLGRVLKDVLNYHGSVEDLEEELEFVFHFKTSSNIMVEGEKKFSLKEILPLGQGYWGIQGHIFAE